MYIGSPLLLTVPAAKAARVAALIRSVHVITQTRASVSKLVIDTIVISLVTTFVGVLRCCDVCLSLLMLLI